MTRVLMLVIDSRWDTATVGVVGEGGEVTQEFNAFDLENALGNLGRSLDSEKRGSEEG